MSLSRFVRPSCALVAAAIAIVTMLPAAGQAQAQPQADSLAARPAQIGLLGVQADVGSQSTNSSYVAGITSTNAATESAVATSIMFTAAPAALTVPRDSVAPLAPLRKQERGNRRTNTTLILVGAAAIIIGAAVGDDAGTILIVGGAGVGLYGLYRLLN